jgi:hypothetical protein
MGKQTAHLFASIPLLLQMTLISPPEAAQSGLRGVASYDVTSVENLMSQADLLLAIDSEGGTIALYGDTTHAARPRYRLMLLDQAPAVLTVEDNTLPMRRDSGWLTTWAAAMEALGQYPWPHLECRMVHPAVAAPIWEALQNYVDRTGHSPIPSSWGRWRRACAQS